MGFMDHDVAQIEELFKAFKRQYPDSNWRYYVCFSDTVSGEPYEFIRPAEQERCWLMEPKHRAAFLPYLDRQAVAELSPVAFVNWLSNWYREEVAAGVSATVH